MRIYVDYIRAHYESLEGAELKDTSKFSTEGTLHFQEEEVITVASERPMSNDFLALIGHDVSNQLCQGR